MPVIHLPAHKVRALEPIHLTPARCGVFVDVPRPAPPAPRPRCTGPQAHLHCYMADERSAVDRQVQTALVRFGAIVGALTVGMHVARAFLGGSAL